MSTTVAVRGFVLDVTTGSPRVITRCP